MIIQSFNKYSVMAYNALDTEPRARLSIVNIQISSSIRVSCFSYEVYLVFL